MAYESFLDLDMLGLGSYEDVAVQGYYEPAYETYSAVSLADVYWLFECPYNLHITAPLGITITVITFLIFKWLKKKWGKPENGGQFGTFMTISYGIASMALVITSVLVVHVAKC